MFFRLSLLSRKPSAGMHSFAVGWRTEVKLSPLGRKSVHLILVQ
jgi:hypothetical protein